MKKCEKIDNWTECEKRGCYFDTKEEIKKLLSNVFKYTIDGKEVSEKELCEYISQKIKERNEE